MKHLIIPYVLMSVLFVLGDKATARTIDKKVSSSKTIKTLSLDSFSHFNSEAQKAVRTLVISDIDDTLKASHINSFSDSSRYSFYTDNPFSGTNDLLAFLAHQFGADSVRYVTNAYKFLSGSSHTKFLKQNNYPPGEIFFRSGSNHKYNTIERLIKSYKPETLILLGDNAEGDIQVFHEIANDFSNPKLKILQYIHIAYDKDKDILDLYEEQIGFTTSLEIALDLALQGAVTNDINLMSLADHLSETVLQDNPTNDGHGPQLFPDWKKCRQFIWNLSWDSVLPQSNLVDQAKQFILSKCYN